MNAGMTCTVIIGHKEIEGLQKVRSFRDLEEFSGSSVEIFPEDLVFSCHVDAVRAPFSVGIPNKGKDVTIIVHGEKPEETDEATDKAEKIKKLQAEFMKKHEELNRLAEQIDELEND